MKTMWSKEELIKLIEEQGGGIDRYIKAISKLESGDGIDWENQLGAHQQFKITPELLSAIIKGSDTIVVDITEEGDQIEIHLDADVIAKLDRALLLPLSVSEFKLVGVSPLMNKKKFLKKGVNATEQSNVGLGSMFAIEEGKMNLHLYEHRLTLTIKNEDKTSDIGVVSLSIINNTNVAIERMRDICSLYSNDGTINIRGEFQNYPIVRGTKNSSINIMIRGCDGLTTITAILRDEDGTLAGYPTVIEDSIRQII